MAITHCVSRFLVELLRTVKDFRCIDLLGPILWFDFFDGDRHCLFAVVQDIHHVFRDFFGESSLLLFGLSGPEFYDDMRHSFLRCCRH
jgi:hypothetical protein